MGDVTRHVPTLGLRTAHSGAATQHTAQGNPESSTTQRRHLEGQQLHLEVARPHTAREPYATARYHVAAAGRGIVEAKVGVHQHRAWLPTHHKVPVERAGARELHGRRQLVDDGRAQVCNREVSTANDELRMLSRGHARNGRVAHERGIVVLEIHVVDRKRRGITLELHAIAQRATTHGGELWIEPAQVGQRHR